MNIAVLFMLAVAVVIAINSDNAAKRKRKLQESGIKKVAEMPKKLQAPFDRR